MPLQRTALLLTAFCLFAGIANLHSQNSLDSQDAQGKDDSDRDTALQNSFTQFPLLQPLTNTNGQPEFQTLPLTNPVVINHERFFGFRFTVPPRKHNEDLDWAFVLPGDLKEWYILPQTGTMNGFADYSQTSKGDYLKSTPLLPLNASHLILQCLPGDSLKDGQTYLIWFGFGNYNAPAMSVMFTFGHYDSQSPHPLVAFERLLALNQTASDPIVNPSNGHTYLLLRPFGWERAEKVAEQLGGHLATIRNQAEEDWIFKTFGNYGGTRRLLWTGLNDTENRFHFSWASGESASYTDWAPHEPNNAGPRGEDYVAIFYPGHRQENKWKVWNTRIRDPIGLPMDGVVEIIPTNNPEISQPLADSIAVQIKPDITITNSDGNIKLAWPMAVSGYVLEATTNLSDPFAPFGYSEQTNITTGVIYVVITNPSPQMFFKLEKPSD